MLHFKPVFLLVINSTSAENAVLPEICQSVRQSY